MLNPNTQLTIKYSDNGVFSDFSQDFQDFTRDTQALNLELTNDDLYIGYYKPINKVYIDMNTPNSVSNILTIQCYNGVSYVNVSGDMDETKGLTRSGFIQWDRAQTDQAKSTVDGEELYWYKISASATHADAVINGINLIFADDKDLAEQIPEINDAAHLTGKPSHILAHVAAKKAIIQTLRNRNYGKRDENGTLQDITAWDLLDIDQINQAATMKALSIIFFNYSDEVNDRHETKSRSYAKQYKMAMELAVLNLDVDDDGVKDSGENHAEMKQRRVTR